MLTHTPVLDLDRHLQLIRITQDDEGNAVDWVGYFGYLNGGTITEGYAYEAFLNHGKPMLRFVRNGRCVRLYTNSIRFEHLGHFKWRRRSDGRRFCRQRKRLVSIPCIPVDAVKSDHVFDDPELTTIQRSIATLRAVIEEGKPRVMVAFRPEDVDEPETA